MADPHRFAGLTPDELDQALFDLGRHIAYPATPDLTTAVRARIAAGPPRRSILRWPTSAPWQRLAAAVIALLIVGVAALALFPSFRHAVADRLGVDGIRIVFERETPTPEPTITPLTAATPGSTPAPATPIGTGLLLGRPTTLDEAQAQVPFVIHAPTLPGLGPPDEIYIRTLGDGVQMVSLLYQPAPGLPETEETGVGALLMQFRGGDDVDYLAKGLHEGDSDLQFVTVNGERGWWATGSSRLMILPDPSEVGCCGAESRSSGNVLLWVQDGITFRLESSLSLDDALAIATTLAVYPPPAATPGTPTP